MSQPADLSVSIVSPGSFAPEQHWYPKALNAQIHPLVLYFMNMTNERIVQRYSYLNPTIDSAFLLKVLHTKPKYFRWAGTDLMHVTDTDGKNQIVVIETNSCPSGQKSFPLTDENDEKGSYRQLIEHSFVPMVKKSPIKNGVVAVFYDKNPMENTGYASMIADALKKNVYLVYYDDDAVNKYVRYNNDKKQIELLIEEQWTPVKTIFRYVTQKPWNRLPLFSRTKIFNPVIVCLSGGRNKLIAAKAYDIFNAELEGTGLKIQTPKTIWDVNKNEIPLWIERFGGKAVIKIPYSNAGQGVFPILTEKDLKDFMAEDYPYEKWIVQSLIGHYGWSSHHDDGLFYQVGTIPSKRGNSYVFDLRMMVSYAKTEFRPIALYSRKTEEPLSSDATAASAQDMLMTNLSFKTKAGEWGSDVSRLLLMDRRDFNKLGLSLDDLIKGYIQSVLAMTAIDSMAQKFVSTKKTFKKKLFRSLNDDKILLDEIMSLL